MGMFSSNFSTAWGMYFSALKFKHRKCIYTCYHWENVSVTILTLYKKYCIQVDNFSFLTLSILAYHADISCWTCHHDLEWSFWHALEACLLFVLPQIQTFSFRCTFLTGVVAIFELQIFWYKSKCIRINVLNKMWELHHPVMTIFCILHIPPDFTWYKYVIFVQSSVK